MKTCDRSLVASFPKINPVKIDRITSDTGRKYIINDKNSYSSVTTILNGIFAKDLEFYQSYMMKREYYKQLKDIRSLNLLESYFEEGKKIEMVNWFKEFFKRADEAADKHRDNAGEFGTIIHDKIDEWIRNNMLNTNREAVNNEVESMNIENQVALKSFLKWFDETNIILNPIGDTFIYSDKYGYAGALDCIGFTSKSELVVIDFKTSSKISKSHFLQVSAYLKAFEKMVGCEVHKALILRLNKKNRLNGKIPLIGYEVVEISKNNLDLAFNAFLSTIEVKKFLSETE